MTCHLRRQFSSARSTKQFWQCQLCRCKLISSSTHPATNRVLSSSPQSIAQPAFCPRKFVARRDLGLSRLYRPALRFIPWFSSLDGREISGYSRVREKPGILFVYIYRVSRNYILRVIESMRELKSTMTLINISALQSSVMIMRLRYRLFYSGVAHDRRVIYGHR